MQHSNTQKLLWYLTSVISFITIFVLYYNGMLYKLYIYDKSMISFIILGLYILTTLILGIKIVTRRAYDIENYWFIGAMLFRLGLAGTLIGVLIMLTSLIGGDTLSINDVSTVVVSIMAGVGTAILTTLAGIATTSFLQIQLMIIRDKNKNV